MEFILGIKSEFSLIEIRSNTALTMTKGMGEKVCSHSKTQNLFKRPGGLRVKVDRPLRLGTLSPPRRDHLHTEKEAMMDRWLEYDLVALAMLVFGIAAVEFLALSF